MANAPSRAVAVTLVLDLFLALAACGRRGEAPAAANSPGTVAKTASDAAQPSDAVVAQVDGQPLAWSALQHHLRALQGQPQDPSRGPEAREAPTPEQLELQAAVIAASDLLIVREMAVVGAPAQPTETAAQAAERFLAQVWDGKRGCALTEAEVRLAYMQDLAKFKHPPGWTVWDLQSACCGEQHQCGLVEQERCRKELRRHLEQLAQTLRKDYAALPALGPAADATELTLEASPLKQRHLPRLEELAAELQASGKPVRLLRYSFWQQGLAGFEGARFRRGDPSVEKAVQSAQIGEVLGPFDGDDALHVAVVAARQPLALGLPKSPTATDEHPVALQLRGKLCLEAAVAERQLYRQKLVQGAVIRWDLKALQGRLSPAALQKLAAMAQRGFGR